MGLKVSDEYTVPLCRGHHRQLHQAGDEIAWWKTANIDALTVAKALWKQTHASSHRSGHLVQSTLSDANEATKV
jgi:hypothetical protein